MWKSLFRHDKILSNLNNMTKHFSEVKPKECVDRMKSWQVHSYSEDLQCCAVRIPIVRQPTELLIKIEAASVNPIDVAMKDGYGQTVLKLFKCQNAPLPITLGRDFCGSIIDKGHGVDSKYNTGDVVYGVIPFHKEGSHAEMTVVDQSYVCHMPRDILSHTEAASLPYAALTAWSALWVFGLLAFQNVKGKRVLILGASGGVGTCAVQILKAYNATVFGTCSTDAVPLVQRLKADCVFDYTSSDFTKLVASQGSYDIILDCAQFGHQQIPSSWQYTTYITLNSPLLHNTDKYGLLGGLACSAANIIPANLCSVPQGKCVKWAYFIPCSEGMSFVDKLVRQCELLPVIDTVCNFEDTMQAYERTKAGHLRGKVVIDML